MNSGHSIVILALIILLHVIVNLLLSKETIDWIPSPGKKLLIIGGIWCIPLMGAIFAYKYLRLNWFRSSQKNPNGGTGASGGFLELDAIFNPGARHVIEARQKEQLEVKKEGEMYNPNATDIIVDKSSKTNSEIQ